jgi:hypothetical protein
MDPALCGEAVCGFPGFLLSWYLGLPSKFPVFLCLEGIFVGHSLPLSVE